MGERDRNDWERLPATIRKRPGAVIYRVKADTPTGERVIKVQEIPRTSIDDWFIWKFRGHRLSRRSHFL